MNACEFEINGLPVRAEFPEEATRKILMPLIARLKALRREKGRRILVFLAGPPAAGKSTLCRYLETLCPQIQTLGLDGFHYANGYLESHFLNGMPLRKIKGAPETYDTDLLAEKLTQLCGGNVRFPVYDRRLHDPIPDAVEITGGIIVLEGNWLLLDTPPWNALNCDYSIFLRMDSPEQIERVVRRKVAGGFSEDAARAFAERNDRANIAACLAHSRRADLNIEITDDGKWREII